MTERGRGDVRQREKQPAHHWRRHGLRQYEGAPKGKTGAAQPAPVFSPTGAPGRDGATTVPSNFASVVERVACCRELWALTLPTGRRTDDRGL